MLPAFLVPFGASMAVGAAIGGIMAGFNGGNVLRGVVGGALMGGVGGFAVGSLMGGAGGATTSVLGASVSNASLYSGIAAAIGGYAAGMSEANRARQESEILRQREAAERQEKLLKQRLDFDKAALNQELEKVGLPSEKMYKVERRINAARLFDEWVEGNDVGLEEGLGDLYAV